LLLRAHHANCTARGCLCRYNSRTVAHFGARRRGAKCRTDGDPIQTTERTRFSRSYLSTMATFRVRERKYRRHSATRVEEVGVSTVCVARKLGIRRQAFAGNPKKVEYVRGSNHKSASCRRLTARELVHHDLDLSTQRRAA
jgi:hypothetical protein